MHHLRVEALAVPARVAEYAHRPRLLGGRTILRVDLHGVSVFGPGEAKTLIRWEWVEQMGAGSDGVTVSSASEKVIFPPGAFGLEPDALLAKLQEARSITDRAEVIAVLAGA